MISPKLLCNQYANDAYTVVNQILQNQAEETALYDAAVNFLPRLIGEVNSLTAENVVSIIEGILQDTQSESLKITCVQALLEVGTPSAANAVYELREVLLSSL
ncbi:hypothetical protein [Oscillibacter sp.]|uniref:hypothetical protein n=1 Tax=Oscillibacter sp. TaxID=1945593 RepID=UPI0033967077